MTGRKNRISSVLIAAALIFGIIPAARVSAAVMNEVIAGADSRVLASCLDHVDDDFNHATVDWEISGGTAEAVQSPDRTPFSVFEGSRSLLVTAGGYTAGASVVLTKKAASFSDAADMNYYSATFWFPEEMGEVIVSLSLSARRGGTYSTSAPVPTGGWQTVFFDLSESGLSGAGRTLKLSVSASESGDFSFLTDMAGASSYADAVQRTRYLAVDYTASGCRTDYRGGVMAVTLSGEGQYIEALSPVVNDFSGGTGLRVRLKNSSTCRSLTLYYTTISSSEYSDSRALTCRIPEGSGVVSVTFPIPDAYTGRFRIVFDGSCTGEMEILSVTPALCYTSQTGVGSVDACEISSDKKNLTVRGTLSAEEAEKYADCPLYLYRLPLYGDASAITTDRAATAETRLSGSGFAFTVGLSGNGSELYAKYAVMAYYSGTLVRIGDALSVTNPEILSADRISFSKATKKGVYPITGVPVLDAISHTAVEIRLDEIISLGTEGTMTHTTGDVTCTLDGKYVTALDEKMKLYENCGINVTFILTAGYSDDISVASLINHPSSSGGNRPAFNTATDEGINTLRAVCDFLAVRYSTAGGITSNAGGYTVGAGINRAAENYNMGETDLVRFARNYSAALRVVYAAVKSVSSEVSVYIPLEGRWHSAVNIGQRASFDARTALEAIAACIKEGGDIGWRLSYDPWADGISLYWENRYPDMTEETGRINIPNAEVLVSFLGRDGMLYNGLKRSMIFLGTGVRTAADTNETIKFSADYVLSYLRLCGREFDTVTALIPSHPVNYNDTLKYIDSNLSAEKTGYASELAGELYSSLFDAASVASRYISEGKAGMSVPSAVKGESVISGFASGDDGWNAVANCASLRGGASLGDRNGLLSVRFTAAGGGYRGVGKTFDRALDLTAVDYIGFEIQAAVLPEGVDSLLVTVVVRSGSSYQSSVCSVGAGEMTTVVADIKDFPRRSSCDGISVFVSGENGEDIGEPTLLIGSVRAMSLTKSSPALDSEINPPDGGEEVPTVTVKTLLTVGGISLLALICEFVRIRKRQTPRETV